MRALAPIHQDGNKAIIYKMSIYRANKKGIICPQPVFNTINSSDKKCGKLRGIWVAFSLLPYRYVTAEMYNSCGRLRWWQKCPKGITLAIGERYTCGSVHYTSPVKFQPGRIPRSFIIRIHLFES